jgi:hypothetical protein
MSTNNLRTLSARGALISKTVLGIVLASIVSVGALSGCDDRGGTVFNVDPETGNPTWINNHAFVESQFSQLDNLPTTWIRVYTPPGETPQLGLTRPYPVLYMLSPFDGDHFFYFHHGVHEVMDRLIESGEIEPFIVVCINGSANAFGGSFYSNYITTGQFQSVITPAVWSYVDSLFYTLPGSEFRGISGYEMGGYGALRCAIAPDTLTGGPATALPSFGSVSAVSAPLNFSDPTNGFPALFKQVSNEFPVYEDIDTSSAAPITNFLMAAAAGFSPEDTAYSPNPIPFWLDVFSWPTFTVDSINKIYDSSIIDTFIIPRDDTLVDTVIDNGVVPPDTTIDSTWIDTVTIYNPPTDKVFPTFPNTHTLEDDKMRLFLPFDAAGDPYAPIWPIWQTHDMPSLFSNVAAETLDSLSGNVLLMATPAARYGHYQQTRDFETYLENTLVPSVSAEFIEYSGHDGFADDGSRYLYEVWPTILKFHSDKFHRNLPAELKISDLEYKTRF